MTAWDTGPGFVTGCTESLLRPALKGQGVGGSAPQSCAMATSPPSPEPTQDPSPSEEGVPDTTAPAARACRANPWRRWKRPCPRPPSRWTPRWSRRRPWTSRFRCHRAPTRGPQPRAPRADVGIDLAPAPAAFPLARGTADPAHRGHPGGGLALVSLAITAYVARNVLLKFPTALTRTTTSGWPSACWKVT